MDALVTKNHHEVVFTGSDAPGPLPAIFYFSLSGRDSLSLDPFNQPVKVWETYPLRIYSMTIPGHDEQFQGDRAINIWKERLEEGHDPFSAFFQDVSQAIDDLCEEGLVDASSIGVAGLSRGVFVAAHVAALNPRISHLLGFAPLTTLSVLPDFSAFKRSDIESFDLTKLVDILYNRTHRYYIGNCDKRVSTYECCRYVMALAETMQEHDIRTPPAELLMKPSIGKHGHGTSKTVFEEGSHWLGEALTL